MSAARSARRAIASLPYPRVMQILWRTWQGEEPAAVASAGGVTIQIVQAVLAAMRERLDQGPAAGAPIPKAGRRGKPPLDLTGQVFGRLTALERAGTGPDGKTRWRCRCKCGGEKVATTRDLRRGITKSCGCLGDGRVVDLTGGTFGRLTVVARAGANGGAHRGARWRCRCECGGEVDVLSTALRGGFTRSCGCLRREASAANRKRAVSAPMTSRIERGKRPDMDRQGGSGASRERAVSARFDDDERAMIEAAIAAGNVTRIEQGEWPDVARQEVSRWRRRQ